MNRARLIMSSLLGNPSAAIIGAAAALFVLLNPRVEAADEAVERYLAYSGTLSEGGKNYDGVAEMVFRLYNSETSESSVWEETLSVNVHNGAFQAMLGSSSDTSLADLTTATSADDDLYLAVAVKDGDTERTLSGRQRFMPMPYVMWSPTGSRAFTVQSGGVTVTDGIASNGVDEAALVVIGDASNDKYLLFDGNSLESSTHVDFLTGTNLLTIDEDVISPDDEDVDLEGAAEYRINGKSAMSILETGWKLQDLHFNYDESFETVAFNGPMTVRADTGNSADLLVKGTLDMDDDLVISDTTTIGGTLETGATFELPGNLDVNGTLHAGLVQKTCSNALECTCDDGYVAISGGGGCGNTSVALRSSYRTSTNSKKWEIGCPTDSTYSGRYTTVMCARF